MTEKPLDLHEPYAHAAARVMTYFQQPGVSRGAEPVTATEGLRRSINIGIDEVSCQHLP